MIQNERKDSAFMRDVAGHYKGKKGESYFSGRFDNRHNLGRVYQTRYFAPFCNETHVLLDFGCGDGTMLRHLPASQRIGIEVNEACVRRIREENFKLDVPIKVYKSFDNIANDIIDLVISNHALEHVPNPLLSLQQMERVLKPGGKLIIVIPFDDWRNRLNRTWDPANKDWHLFTWAPVNIGNLLTEAGFMVLNVKLCRFSWSPRFYWIYDFFGKNIFDLACRAFSRLKQRMEIFCQAEKPASENNACNRPAMPIVL